MNKEFLEQIVKDKYNQMIFFCENAVKYYNKKIKNNDYRVTNKKFYNPINEFHTLNYLKRYSKELSFYKNVNLDDCFSQDFDIENFQREHEIIQELSKKKRKGILEFQGHKNSRILFLFREEIDKYTHSGLIIKYWEGKILFDKYGSVENRYYNEKCLFRQKDFKIINKNNLSDFLYNGNKEKLNEYFFKQPENYIKAIMFIISNIL